MCSRCDHRRMRPGTGQHLDLLRLHLSEVIQRPIPAIVDRLKSALGIRSFALGQGLLREVRVGCGGRILRRISRTLSGPLPLSNATDAKTIHVLTTDEGSSPPEASKLKRERERERERERRASGLQAITFFIPELQRQQSQKLAGS